MSHSHNETFYRYDLPQKLLANLDRPHNLVESADENYPVMLCAVVIYLPRSVMSISR